MELSTQTSHLAYVFGLSDSLYEFARAGYKYLDLSLFHMSWNGSPFNAPEWKENVIKFGECAEKCGIRFNQAHIPFEFDWGKKGEWESHIKEIHDRSLDICGMLKVKNVVVHPIHHMEYAGHEREIHDINVRYYGSLIPYCEKYGYKIGIENMWRREIKTKRICHDTCSRMEELISYIEDSGGTEYFVACFDIGHAALVGFEPEDCIRQLGHKYLHCLHVHDNDYRSDQHLLPGQGRLNWDEICKALAEIDYDGDFTFEADSFLHGFPKDMLPAATRFMVEIGHLLCDKTEKYRETFRRNRVIDK